MAVNPNEDTEFNDALRKHGILPPREPTPPSPSPPGSPDLDDLLNDFDDDELRELGEDSKNEETAKLVEAFRLQRLADETIKKSKARFGRVYPIGRDDYTREVTEASNVDEEGDEENLGTGVICFLYKDGIPRSDRTFVHIRTLAERYPRTKFVSIVGDKCIPNLPDSRIPMLIVYKKGDIRNQIIAWAADKERSLEELEALFILGGVLHPPDRPPPRRRDSDDDSDDDNFVGRIQSKDASSRMRSAGTGVNGKTTRNIRRKNESDDEDDFEFDM
ncbi:thioredoxin-like protein [Flagelloscypha sp. PMI_526]|nr:thioredoxin-like protein [Flagelloscypha sp. PMI_526]